MTHSGTETATGRSARAELGFVAGAGRTVLARQFVPYPFHVTRPFRLDPDRPDIATLYLQSASGGLYRGDDLHLALTAGVGASAHVTTQAATVVHDTAAFPARQHVAIRVARDAFLAFTPDPLVLLPGAACVGRTRISLAPGARAIVSEIIAWHDLENGRRPFDFVSQLLHVEDETGRPLVHEAGRLAGQDFLAEASPLGPFRAVGSLLILGRGDALPEAASLRKAADGAGCLTGVGLLPNGAGLLVRSLGTDGSTVRNAFDAVFAQAFRAMIGVMPTVRRK